jgi:hypothetical protein
MSVASLISSSMSFVERLGTDAMKGIKDVAGFAAKAQPVANFIGGIISVLEPQLAPVVSTVLITASYVEGQFAAAGNATGSGTQKLATVSALLGPLVVSTLTAAKKPAAAADVDAFISNVVNLGKNNPNLWAQLEMLLGQPVTQAPAIANIAAPAKA